MNSQKLTLTTNTRKELSKAFANYLTSYEWDAIWDRIDSKDGYWKTHEAFKDIFTDMDSKLEGEARFFAQLMMSILSDVAYSFDHELATIEHFEYRERILEQANRDRYATI